MKDRNPLYTQSFMDKYGISWFKFDEPSGNVTDSKGTAVGTINGGVTRVAGCNGQGNALSFNGTNGYLQFDQKVIPVGKKSIRFKIKTNETGGSLDTRLISNADGTVETGLRIRINALGYLVFENLYSVSGTSNFYAVTSDIINDGEWHDVLCTWDGTTDTDGVKLYLDGTLSMHPSSYGAKVLETEPLRNLVLGRNPNTSHSAAFAFNGQLDNLEIYNDVIDPLANKILISSEENKYHSMISGIAKYSFEETGDTIIDSLGNNNGVNYGATVVQGYKGNARRFTKSSSNRIAFNSTVIPTTSIGIRFKIRKNGISTDGRHEMILSTGHSTTQNTCIVYIPYEGNSDAGHIVAKLSNAGNDMVVTTAGSGSKYICDNQWHDVAIIFDHMNRLVKIFIDSMSIPCTVKSYNSTTIPSKYDRNLIIGGSYSTTGTPQEFFNGELDEVEIYNYVINPSAPNTLISMDNASEDNFIRYGADSIKDLQTPIGNIKSVINNSNSLGDRKIFAHTLDMSKYRGIGIKLK